MVDAATVEGISGSVWPIWVHNGTPCSRNPVLTGQNSRSVNGRYHEPCRDLPLQMVRSGDVQESTYGGKGPINDNPLPKERRI